MCHAQGPQCSDAGEARTRGPSASSQALYHWATALYWEWQGLLMLILNSCGNDWDSGYIYWPLEAMTGTLDTFTNIEWQWLGLGIRIITFSAKRQESGYIYWPLVDIDRDSGYVIDLKWKWLGLWILLLVSRGEERTLDTSSDLTRNDKDSGYNYWSLVAMTGTLDSFTDLSQQWEGLDTSTNL